MFKIFSKVITQEETEHGHKIYDKINILKEEDTKILKRKIYFLLYETHVHEIFNKSRFC